MIFANVLKHVVLNLSMTGPYDYFKEGFYTRFGEYGFVNPLALSLAAFSGAFFTLPFDNIKTKLMQEFQLQPDRNRISYGANFMRAV